MYVNVTIVTLNMKVNVTSTGNCRIMVRSCK